jgi:hypothetical protein
MNKSMPKYWHEYPVYEHEENKLFLLGNSSGRLICKISSVNLNPSEFSQLKQKDSTNKNNK